MRTPHFFSFALLTSLLFTAASCERKVPLDSDSAALGIVTRSIAVYSNVPGARVIIYQIVPDQDGSAFLDTVAIGASGSILRFGSYDLGTFGAVFVVDVSKEGFTHDGEVVIFDGDSTPEVDASLKLLTSSVRLPGASLSVSGPGLSWIPNYGYVMTTGDTMYLALGSRNANEGWCNIVGSTLGGMYTLVPPDGSRQIVFVAFGDGGVAVSSAHVLTRP